MSGPGEKCKVVRGSSVDRCNNSEERNDLRVALVRKLSTREQPSRGKKEGKNGGQKDRATREEDFVVKSWLLA